MNLDKLVEEIESDSLSPNTCDEYLGCILTLASSMGEIQLVQSALKKGAVVEGNDSWDVSPLFEACRNNHPEIVQLLLEHGANVNHTTRNGIRPLHIACRGGNIKIVEMLVAAGADIKARTQMGNDAMMEAHKYGHTDCFELLLDKGGYIEEPDPESRGHINGELGRPLQAPFTFFCFRGPIELIKCMLEHKRAKDAIDVQELSFGLLEASLEGRVDVARLLVQYGLDVKMVNTNHESPLQVAAKNGHINFINFLLDSGVDINYTTSEGVTALMEACWNGRYETVKLLVGRGADLNLFSPESLESAISLAAMAGQFGIVKHLTAHGVRIDPLCNVAMLKAIRSGHSFMLQHFVNVGADVNYIHKSTGETALTTACDARSENAVDFLLEKGAKADLAMGDNLTPLMIAAKRGLNSIVDMLIKKRVNLSKVTCDNKHSALSLACCYGHKHVVVKLINAGAKVNHVYANNETLLTYLAKSVHTDVLEAICSFVRVLELDVSEFACRSLDRIQIDKYRHLLDCYREHGFTPIPEYQALKEYFESQDDEQKSKSTRNKQNQPAKGKKRTINRSKLRESTSVESEITSNDTKLGTEDKSSMLNAKVGPGCDTALSISVKLCRIDVVKALAKFGAEVDCRDKSGQTPLMLASKIGRHTMVKTLIESGANVNESCSFKGYSALCYAALHSKTDCAKLLLSAGANKNHAGHDRMTPLCLAVSSGSIEMVKLLLDKKAEADRTSQGPLPIMCSTNPNKEIVSLLLTHGADPQAEYKGVSFFANVCNQSDIETLIFIIDHCRTLNLERKNRFGHTPLMQAVINDQKSVASVLIDAGAEINNTYQANPEKDNPLTTATAMGNYEMMELLLEKGAVVEHRNKNKYTAISVAAIKGDLKAVELLFKKKACASPKNGNQESPLKLALRGGHLDVVTFLSDKVQSFPSETEKDIILSEIAQDNQVIYYNFIQMVIASSIFSCTIFLPLIKLADVSY
ncbi:Ankyrin repeat domain-containing protein 17 [Thelohanellus kitauei]|uniref:Ankyrin repeat domain-containing protein 17 n=1 Tax=Thelohanellus kitauei TaxID=669202 RepID=A0A0C2MQD5_THEKT|nr:Ankyrin repeat domain-containing protein 17 [Thelohanellus kitauei]